MGPAPLRRKRTKQPSHDDGTSLIVLDVLVESGRAHDGRALDWDAAGLPPLSSAHSMGAITCIALPRCRGCA
eukprot:365783-Chlamydomonas_euryale.AAC.22